MLLSQMKEELRVLMDSGNAVEIGSSPGVGKSETIKQWVEEQSARDGFKWGCATVFMATQTPVDLLGYLVPGVRKYHSQDGTEKSERVSEFTRPIWTMSDEGIPLEEYQRSIILMEEADKCDADVTKTSAEIRLNASLGPWKFDRFKVG